MHKTPEDRLLKAVVEAASTARLEAAVRDARSEERKRQKPIGLVGRLVNRLRPPHRDK